jgi:hypothetical protein
LAASSTGVPPAPAPPGSRLSEGFWPTREPQARRTDAEPFLAAIHSQAHSREVELAVLGQRIGDQEGGSAKLLPQARPALRIERHEPVQALGEGSRSRRSSLGRRSGRG